MTSLRERTSSLAALLAAALLASCDDPPKDALESCEQSVVQQSVATDILFVIDDSLSMEGEQQLLRAGLSAFITDLSTSPIRNDFQVGVTTTSVEDFDGTVTYGGTIPYPRGIVTAISAGAIDLANPATWGAFIWSASQGFYGPRILPWNWPTLVTDFETNVLVGTRGAAREQPFAAAELALTTQAMAGNQNVGFLRPGAQLAIIFLSDEDDCSGPRSDSILTTSACVTARSAGTLTPVSHYASFLRGPIGGEPRDVVVAAIVGVTCSGGVCTNTRCSTASALWPANAPADRFVELLGSLNPARTRIASVCDPNFDAALGDFARLIRSRTLPLEGAPADWRMLAVAIDRGTERIACTVVRSDASPADLALADVVYEDPQAGRPATLTFQPQNACALEQGDRIDVKVICAR